MVTPKTEWKNLEWDKKNTKQTSIDLYATLVEINKVELEEVLMVAAGGREQQYQ